MAIHRQYKERIAKWASPWCDGPAAYHRYEARVHEFHLHLKSVCRRTPSAWPTRGRPNLRRHAKLCS